VYNIIFSNETKALKNSFVSSVPKQGEQKKLTGTGFEWRKVKNTESWDVPHMARGNKIKLEKELTLNLYR
jgi:hypothetical protein